MSEFAKMVFVDKLNYETETKTLAEAFSQFGAVAASIIITKRIRGEIKSRGFGYVEFKEEAGAKAAIEKKTIELDGRNVLVSPARERRPRVTAFIAKIPKEVTEDDLKSYFAAQNPEAVIIKRKEIDGEVQNGFGFVKFPTQDALMAAIKDAREIQIKGATMIVKIAKSQAPKRPSRRFGRVSYRVSRRSRKSPLGKSSEDDLLGKSPEKLLPFEYCYFL